MRRYEEVPIAGIVPVRSLGTTGIRILVPESFATIPNSAGVQYNAGVIGLHLPAQYHMDNTTAVWA